MLFIVLMALVSLVCFVLMLPALGIWLSLLLTLVLYVLLHGVVLGFFRICASSSSLDRPIEKQNPVCRWGTANMIAAVNRYRGIRPHITGTEKLPTDTPFLFVCNHRSGFDPLLVMDYLRDYNISFISKPSNIALPLAGRVAYSIGFLPINRENNREALKTILTAADYLKRGVCNVGVYPEGTRSHTRELLPFHAGCFKAAQKANAPIVVAAVHGTEKLKHARLFSHTDVWLDILEVLPAETVCSQKTDALSEHIRARMQEHLDRVESEE